MTNANIIQTSNIVQAIPFANADKLTMSSREIAELTGKSHRHVVRDTEKMLSALGLDLNRYAQTWAHPQNNQEYIEYCLNQELTITLVSGYNIKFRHAIVKRWIELEKQAKVVITNRVEGKEIRKLETDSIKDLIEYAEAQGSKSANMYYSNITRMTNTLLGIESGQRDNLTAKQLSQVSIAETLVKMAINDGIEQSLPYKGIYKLCKDRVSSIANVLLN